jgi:hypothetical protein
MKAGHVRWAGNATIHELYTVDIGPHESASPVLRREDVRGWDMQVQQRAGQLVAILARALMIQAMTVGPRDVGHDSGYFLLTP